jgi:hypothetical protein
MFTKDGNWKEFGLGRPTEFYTWMPFWLFAVGWSILSYAIMLVIASYTGLGGVSMKQDLQVPMEAIEPENVSTKSLLPSLKKKPANAMEMKQGYYILDINETVKRGIPKYTYLGPESPNIIYHNQFPASNNTGMEESGSNESF